MFGGGSDLVLSGRCEDVEEVHALQDAIKVSQKAAGPLRCAQLGRAGQKIVRDALVVLGWTLPDWRGQPAGGGGRPGQAPDRHRDWLGPQPRPGRHLSQHHPAKNDGTTVYSST